MSKFEPFVVDKEAYLKFAAEYNRQQFELMTTKHHRDFSSPPNTALPTYGPSMQEWYKRYRTLCGVWVSTGAIAEADNVHPSQWFEVTCEACVLLKLQENSEQC